MMIVWVVTYDDGYVVLVTTDEERANRVVGEDARRKKYGRDVEDIPDPTASERRSW